MTISAHPYRTQSSRAFWARSVSTNFDPRTLLTPQGFLIRRGDKVVSAGSCFASNLVPFLERAGFDYLRTEQIHPLFAHAIRGQHVLAQRGRPNDSGTRDSAIRLAFNRLRRRKPAITASRPVTFDNLGYPNFSAAYGNIYTVRQLLQLLRRATGRYRPVESSWVVEGEVVDPFRPGLRYRARTMIEFEALTSQHLVRTKQAFAEADVFVVTLGLTEAWVSSRDNAVFPACPGTVAGTFSPDKHVFRNFTAADVSADLGCFITELRDLNPSCRLILTVSPVPLVATATDDHVLCASTYSKSVLRVAAQEAAAHYPDVTYFPAYEIVTGPQSPNSFLTPDRRNVTADAVASVMSALLFHCEVSQSETPSPMDQDPDPMAALSAAILETDCEEAMCAS